MDSNSIPLIIWKPPHGQLILDICKQNCQLSVEYADTINLTIEKIKKFLLVIIYYHNLLSIYFILIINKGTNTKFEFDTH